MTAEPGAGAPMSDRMQSLLSRAVEDQLSEQRQVATALGEVRAQLGRIGQELESLRAHSAAAGAPALDAGIATLAADIREAVRLLGERLDTVGRIVTQSSQEVIEARSSLGELRAAVQAQTGAISGVTGGLGALNALGERVAALQDNLGGLQDRLSGWEELTPAMHQLQQRGEAVETGLRDLRSAFAGIAARIAELPSRGDASQGRYDAPAQELGERLTGIESALPTVATSIDAVLEALERHGRRIDGLQDRLQEVAAATPEVVPGPDDVSERLAALEFAIAAVGRRVNEVGAVVGTTDQSAELAAQVQALHTAISAEQRGQDDVDDRVREGIAKLVADSERRLTEHLDEAVLALAEALLRRRGQRPTGTGAAEPVAQAEATAPSAAPVAQAEATRGGAAEPVAQAEATRGGAAEPVAQAEATPPSADPAAQAEAEPASAELSDADGAVAPRESDKSDEPAKRKPWWKPGD